MDKKVITIKLLTMVSISGEFGGQWTLGIINCRVVLLILVKVTSRTYSVLEQTFYNASDHPESNG